VIKDNFKAGLLVAGELAMYGRNPNLIFKSNRKKSKSSKRSPRSRLISGKKKSPNQESSGSPARDLIIGLTQGKVNVDDNTILLIN
jgi:hypothetical protein